MSNKCQFCNNEACVKIVNIDVKGCVQEVFLCKKHAEEKCTFAEGAYHFLENIPAKNSGIALSKHFCPHCGCSKEWVEKTKHMGCPHCYKVFDDLISEWMHCFKNHAIHFGKIPAQMKCSEKLINAAYKPRLEFFETQMQVFIKAENFEEAHSCRKIIKKILKEKENASINL